MKKNTHRKLQHFLICRTDAIGDLLLTLPVAAAVKAAFPQARISLVVSAYTQELLAHQPEVDQILVWNPNATRVEARSFCAELQRQKIDAALLVFPERRLSWVVFRAGIPVRVGTGRRWWSCLYNHRVGHSRAQALRHEADYNLDLVRVLGVKAEVTPPRLVVQPAAQSWGEEYYQHLGVEPKDRLVIIHPGGRGSSANWSPQAYGRLADLLMQEHGCKVLLTGSLAEQAKLAAVSQVCRQAPLRLDTAVTLPQLTAVLAAAKVVVAGNTGPMHMACALDVPVVALFPRTGVTGPTRWGPLGKRAEVLVPASDRPGDDLESISPAQVAEKILLWLGA